MSSELARRLTLRGSSAVAAARISAHTDRSSGNRFATNESIAVSLIAGIANGSWMILSRYDSVRRPSVSYWAPTAASSGSRSTPRTYTHPGRSRYSLSASNSDRATAGWHRSRSSMKKTSSFVGSARRRRARRESAGAAELVPLAD